MPAGWLFRILIPSLIAGYESKFVARLRPDKPLSNKRDGCSPCLSCDAEAGSHRYFSPSPYLTKLSQPALSVYAVPRPPLHDSYPIERRRRRRGFELLLLLVTGFPSPINRDRHSPLPILTSSAKKAVIEAVIDQ